VTRAKLMRFLFAYQHVGGTEPRRGPTGLCAAIEQLAGYTAPAVSWEPDILSVRVQGYDPAWLDQLCLSGAVAWGRITPPDTGRAARPVRTTPIALWPRELTELVRGTEQIEDAALSSAALATRAALGERGASFVGDLRNATGLLPSQLDDALAELVACGLATSDSFAGLRALITPLRHRRPRPQTHAAPAVVDPMARAGRFSLWPSLTQAADPALLIESHARLLLRRYGVVFRKLLERESHAPPWRELVRVYRRMEAAGTLRGGRFVDGMSGEQFALPEAVAMLRKLRREPPGQTLVALSAADPLCLLGIILPGERIAATTRSRVLFRDGLAVAVREHGEVRFLQEPESEVQRWDAQMMLRRREVTAALRAYRGTTM
jgi:ATP-dependent Lhr-like helicase